MNHRRFQVNNTGWPKVIVSTIQMRYVASLASFLEVPISYGVKIVADANVDKRGPASRG
jgi:hypothetical protein